MLTIIEATEDQVNSLNAKILKWEEQKLALQKQIDTAKEQVKKLQETK